MSWGGRFEVLFKITDFGLVLIILYSILCILPVARRSFFSEMVGPVSILPIPTRFGKFAYFTKPIDNKIYL